MKQKRKVKSLISEDVLFDKSAFKTLLIAGGCTLVVGAIFLFALSIGVAGATSTEGDTTLNYDGIDDKLEVLYHLGFIKNAEDTADSDQMKMKGNTLYLTPRPVVINGYETEWTRNSKKLKATNKIVNNVYSNILGGDNIEVNSNNITIIAGGGYNEESKILVEENNDNATVLGGQGIEIKGSVQNGDRLPPVMIGGNGNTINSLNKNGNTIIGGTNNKIEQPAEGSTILGGNSNHVYNSDTIVGGSNVKVNETVGGPIFAFSSSDEDFNPQTSNAFYLNVENGLGINTGGVDGVTSNGAVSFGEININTEKCTSDNIGIEGSWNGCLVGCTEASEKEGWWEMLDRGEDCEIKCKGSNKCIYVEDKDAIDHDDYDAYCTTDNINIENAELCYEDDLKNHKNVIFESSLVDVEGCPTNGENQKNKCVYKCKENTRLKEKWNVTCGEEFNVSENEKKEEHASYDSCEKLEDGSASCLPVYKVYKLTSCDENYHTEDGKVCISNFDSKQCTEGWKPDNSDYVRVMIDLTWKGTWKEGSWTPNPIPDCEWKCIYGHHQVGDNSCESNFDWVTCDSSIELPSNGHYTSTSELVPIEWKNGEWTKPAQCPWDCEDGYDKVGNECVPRENVTTKPCEGDHPDWGEGYQPGIESFSQKCVTGEGCTPPDGDPSTIRHYHKLETGHPAACEYTCGNGYHEENGVCVENKTYVCKDPENTDLFKVEGATKQGKGPGSDGDGIKTLYKDKTEAEKHTCGYYCDPDNGWEFLKDAEHGNNCVKCEEGKQKQYDEDGVLVSCTQKIQPCNKYYWYDTENKLCRAYGNCTTNTEVVNNMPSNSVGEFDDIRPFDGSTKYLQCTNYAEDIEANSCMFTCDEGYRCDGRYGCSPIECWIETPNQTDEQLMSDPLFSSYDYFGNKVQKISRKPTIAKCEEQGKCKYPEYSVPYVRREFYEGAEDAEDFKQKTENLDGCYYRCEDKYLDKTGGQYGHWRCIEGGSSGGGNNGGSNDGKSCSRDWPEELYGYYNTTYNAQSDNQSWIRCTTKGCYESNVSKGCVKGCTKDMEKLLTDGDKTVCWKKCTGNTKMDTDYKCRPCPERQKPDTSDTGLGGNPVSCIDVCTSTQTYCSTCPSDYPCIDRTKDPNNCTGGEQITLPDGTVVCAYPPVSAT